MRCAFRLLALTAFLLIPTTSPAVDVDRALQAASKPKKDADVVQIDESTRSAKAKADSRVEGLLAERQRQRQALLEKWLPKPGEGDYEGTPEVPVAPAARGQGNQTYECQFRCTDHGVVNEGKGDFMKFTVRAASQSDAHRLAREAAGKACSARSLVVRTEWAGVGGCRKL